MRVDFKCPSTILFDIELIILSFHCSSETLVNVSKASLDSLLGHFNATFRALFSAETVKEVW